MPSSTATREIGTHVEIDMSNDGPALVFSGPYAEVLFLKTLIESAGIETSLNGPPYFGGRLTVGSELYVRQADVQQASELIDHFLKNGRRTKY